MRFAPLIAKQLRTKRRGQAGQSWYVDETYVKVRGKWCYLSRAIDAESLRARPSRDQATILSHAWLRKL
jgi:transposase-like protein